MKETVLVIGSTGHIGVSAVLGALGSGRHVLAVVRNQASAAKLHREVGSSRDITTVEADVTSENGVKGVVDQVTEGKLPSFQHVYASVGGMYETASLTDLSVETIRRHMLVNFESNLFAYRATILHLLAQEETRCSWTVCTGAAGEVGEPPAPAISQGALFSLAKSLARTHRDTNVRFNEVFLAMRVEMDSVAAQNNTVKSSEFGAVYNQLLDRNDIKGSRVSVRRHGDMKDLRHKKIDLGFQGLD